MRGRDGAGAFWQVGRRPAYELTMSRLGEDEHGVWLGAPERSTTLWPDCAFTASVERVWCFVRDSGWTAAFHPRDRHDIATYVDNTTNPEWSHDRDPASDVVSMVDLDRRLRRDRHGRESFHSVGQSWLARYAAALMTGR